MRQLTHHAPVFNPAIARVIPIGIYLLFLATAPWIEPYLPDGRWQYPIMVTCVAIALGILAPQFEELRGTLRINCQEWLSAVLVGVMVFVLWINLEQPWASIGTPTGFDPRNPNGEVDYALAALRIACAALVVPIMEELFWRSFIMRWIEQTTFFTLHPGAVTWRGLVVSSVLFGVEHNLWLAGILVGLAYGGLYIRSGKLRSAIAAHAVTNFLLGSWVVYSSQWQFW